jgi:hypothetical protein
MGAILHLERGMLMAVGDRLLPMALALPGRWIALERR